MGRPAKACSDCSGYERKHRGGPPTYGWCRKKSEPTHAGCDGSRCDQYDGADNHTGAVLRRMFGDPKPSYKDRCREAEILIGYLASELGRERGIDAEETIAQARSSLREFVRENDIARTATGEETDDE